MNLATTVQPAVHGDPGRVAMVVEGEPVTYGELGAAVASAASALAARSVGPGDRVLLVDECSVLFVATVLGAAHVGAAAAPASHRLAPGELRDLHAAAGCGDVSVAGADSVRLVGEALGRSPLPPSIVLGWGAGAPPAATVASDDDAVVLFTSGTTGLPRPVTLSHGALVSRVQHFAGPFDASRPPGVALMCVPAVHVGGLVGLLVALAGGSTTVVQRRFDAGEWLRLVEEHRVQRTFLVPVMVRRILDHPDFERTDLSSLASIAYGAAPATADLVTRAVEALPHVAFSNVFGQTETLGAVTALGPDDHRHPARLGSVGRPLPGVEWRLVEPGGEEPVAPGAAGELQVLQGGRWHGTGDLVRADADGYLWSEGRLSDVVNRGGEKVGPAEVEAVLLAHPSVVDAAVAGVPDEELGERIGAVVVLDFPVAGADLVGWCRDRLAPWKVPERVAVVDEVPRNELGKVRRGDLLRVLGAVIDVER